MINDKQFLDIIEQLYETTFDVRAWGGVLASISDLFKSPMSTLMYQNPNSGHASLVATTNIDSRTAQLYEDYYGPISPLVPHAKRYGVGEVFTDQMLPDQSEYLKSETYNDFFRPGKADHLIQTMLSKDASNLTTILFRRDSRAGPFNSDEISIFTRLVPHFRQATRVYQALAKVKQEKDAITDVVDCLKTGVLLINQRGLVVSYNRAAAQILEDNDGIAIDRFSKCVLSLQDEMAALCLLLGQVCHRGKREEIHPGGSMRISRPSFKRPYSVWVSPVHRAWIGTDDQPAAILFISDPEQSHEMLPEIVSRQFGLTPAETKLAIALADGKSINDIADELGITKSTARSTLKMIFSKTDTNQQSALVSLILALPRIRN